MAKKIAVPGDLLGKEDDFFLVGDAYIDDKGNIIAKEPSFVEYDDDSLIVKEISRAILLKNDEVIAVVEDIRKNMALLKVIKNLTTKKNLELSANIYISNVSNSYLEDLRDAFLVGDLLKLKVVDINPLELSMKDFSYGVVFAYCKKCRKRLFYKFLNRNKDISIVSCNICRTKQSRKFGRL